MYGGGGDDCAAFRSKAGESCSYEPGAASRSDFARPHWLPVRKAKNLDMVKI